MNINIDSVTARLTETILGNDDSDLTETLRGVASDICLSHISYVRLSPDKSTDINMLAAVATYSRLWQQRYFLKKYVTHDPVVSYGREADQLFDWADLSLDDPATKDFFADALGHGVGRNGLSIPLRGPRGVLALVSFTSYLSKDEREAYKAANMNSLKVLAVLIDAASHISFKLPASPVHLSKREEQCLLWAARRKTYQEIAMILGLAFSTVKVYLDTARHKLQCMNLTHAAAVAFATGVFPSQALI